MALTRAQIVTEICDVVGKRVSASSVSGAALQDRVVTYLNFAQRRIARAYSFKDLMTTKTNSATVTSVKTYPLESGSNNLGLSRTKDIHSIRLIDSENSRVLVRWSQRKLDRTYPRPENYATQRPSIYVWFGANVELFRIPDAVYTLWIRYSQWPQELTSASQTSDFQNKDELLVAAGVLESYLALEEYADAAVWERRFGIKSPTSGMWTGLVGDAIRADDADIDWEPEAEPHGGGRAKVESGSPEMDPFGDPRDPLYGYLG